MFNRIPRNIPPLKALLLDIGASPRQAAKALHVSERTVKNWLRYESEPRSVRIALFWLSRWGFSVLDADLTNQIRIYRGLARSQADYIKRLENFSTPRNTLQVANDATFRHSFTKIDNT